MYYVMYKKKYITAQNVYFIAELQNIDYTSKQFTFISY